MTDSISKEKRSWNMSRVRNKNTKPEILVRRLLHRAGFRYRLHKSGLPGRPDVVMSKYKTVIFVNGCFWHRHKNCKDATTPKTRTSFWKKKFEENVQRDERVAAELKELNWNFIISRNHWSSIT